MKQVVISSLKLLVAGVVAFGFAVFYHDFLFNSGFTVVYQGASSINQWFQYIFFPFAPDGKYLFDYGSPAFNFIAIATFLLLAIGIMRKQWLPLVIFFFYLSVYPAVLSMPGTPCSYGGGFLGIAPETYRSCTCAGLEKRRTASDSSYSACIGFAKEEKQ